MMNKRSSHLLSDVHPLSKVYQKTPQFHEGPGLWLWICVKQPIAAKFPGEQNAETTCNVSETYMQMIRTGLQIFNCRLPHFHCFWREWVSSEVQRQYKQIFSLCSRDVIHSMDRVHHPAHTEISTHYWRFSTANWNWNWNWRISKSSAAASQLISSVTSIMMELSVAPLTGPDACCMEPLN